ncbi:MAG TPA: DNA polymerase III subunit gamma/tau, partial [Polyangiales bacterium]|nr:DNA polymerase III subunit gamma/tau [Polyangiales bacterium]
MSYTVLARKYRPQTFADLVGQEHVSRTLGNALQSGRVAHAFLFTGARGVGKTTTARLLAKALNCEQGPTATPCNQCDPCREITAGNDIDVLEIDGASNNGVDDVRRLQETLPFRPARDRFKIVIVDEVHMLSAGAFNAFLKTLEEPPAHVKFVFATTEIHKVPITIRSRCQRYDFRLIPHAVVAERVREILRAEQINADEAAIALVAREAAGSMRDALTVLDQVLALGDSELRGDTVARGLAIASRESVLRVIEALLSGDAAACLQCVAAVAEQGLDLLHFTRQLLECARDLVVLRVVGAGSDAAVALTPDELTRAKQLAEGHERAELERLFGGLTKLIEEVGQAAMPQMTLEMGLVRLASRPPLVAVQELITRLKGFEDLLTGGPQGPQGPTHGGPAPSGFGGGAGSRGPTHRASGPGGLSSGPIDSDAPRQTGPSGGPQLRDASQIGMRGGDPAPRQPGPYAAPQLRDATGARGPGIAPKDAPRQAGPSAAPQLQAAVQPQPTEAVRPPARLVAVPPPAPEPPPISSSVGNDITQQASFEAARDAALTGQRDAAPQDQNDSALQAPSDAAQQAPNHAAPEGQDDSAQPSPRDPLLQAPSDAAQQAPRAAAQQAPRAAAPEGQDDSAQPSPSNAAQQAPRDPLLQDPRDAGGPPLGAAAQQGRQDAFAPALDAASLNLSAGAAAALRLSQRLARNQAPVPARPAKPAQGGAAPAFGAPPPAAPGHSPGSQGAPLPAAQRIAPPPAAGLSALRVAPPPAATSDAPRAAPAILEGDGMTAVWSRIVGQLRSAQPALGAVLDHGMPLEVTATSLRIG